MIITLTNGQIINVPADYSTIQQGIDTAFNGDTVLVQPGTYVENIDYNGKNITVASLFLTTLDTSYISQTIIDGDSILSVVYFVNGEDSTTVLSGFTITNGLGGYTTSGTGAPIYYGGGITCKYGSKPNINNTVLIKNYSNGLLCEESAHPCLTNVIIKENSGGGIYCGDANMDLQKVSITGNNSYRGGGICCWWWCNINMQNVTITNNSASIGGGIFCKNSDLYLQNSTIKHNLASSGGGIFNEGSSLIFDSTDRCNIYSNNSGWRGNDLFSDIYLNVILDTFTVLSPSHFYAEPLVNFSFDILIGKIDQIETDIYVSPIGDNANSGLTNVDPFKTIHYAFSKIRADSLHQNTIHLLEGTYSPSGNEEPLPIIMLDYLSIVGDIGINAIINAEGQSNGLIFDSNTEAYLTNLTFTGGNTSGISIMNSNPDLLNLTISNNAGFGIYCYYSNPGIENISITNNSSSGIYCDNSNPVIMDVYIAGNTADYGGGIYCANSNPDMSNVTITNNTSIYEGGGIYLTESNPVFNTDNRCNIYLNNDPNGKGLGADIFALHNNMTHVIVDTFTVMTPTDYHASPINNFTFDILHSINDNLINSDLYVSVSGDNSNLGTTPDEPFKTINYALSRLYSDSLNHHTIHLLPGTYSQNTNGERFPISMSNYVSLEGSGEEECILDAGDLHGVMRFLFVTNSSISHITIKNGHDQQGGGIYCYESNPVIKHVTITSNYASNSGWNISDIGGGGIYCYKSNPIFENITVADNHTLGSGGGMGLDESNPRVENATITGNTSEYGGGIICIESSPRLSNVYITGNSVSGAYGSSGGGLSCAWDSDPVLENVVITGNSASWDGGGIGCGYSSSPILKNVTVSNNTARDHGGGIYLTGHSSSHLINCIIWNNFPQEIGIYGNYSFSEITVSWSDIEGGLEGIILNQWGLVHWLDGNLDEDPLFTGTGDDPYALSEYSPCIDAGIPDTSGLNLLPWDIIGNVRIWDGNGNDTAVIDMGAYEYIPIPIEISEFGTQNTELRFKCYPNPFSTSVTMEYELTKAGTIEMKIYNQIGQMMGKTLQVESKKGKNKIEWQASEMSTGIYFIGFRFGNQVVTKKILKH